MNFFSFFSKGTPIRQRIFCSNVSLLLSCLYGSQERPLNNSHRVLEVDKSAGRVIDLDNYTVSQKTSKIIFIITIRQTCTKSDNFFHKDGKLSKII